MKKITLFWIFVLISLNLIYAVFAAYTPPDKDSIALVLNSSYTPPDKDSIALVLGEVAAPTDSCTCSGNENCAIDCSDGCNITDNVKMNQNNISMTGTGDILITANISDFNYVTIKGACDVKCSGGCFLW